MTLIDRLNQIIAEYDLLQHPFYQAWNRGELSVSCLQHYAAQYYSQVSSFPRFISKVHTGCPELAVRQELVRNLADEEISGIAHPDLWMQFATGIGACEARVRNEAPLTETAAMVDTYYELAENWAAGLCALYAYEKQVPAVSISKIEGLKKHYGISDDKTLAFFSEHQVYDVEHAARVAALIEAHVDPLIAEEATRKAAQSLWQFLDGMCQAENISCH